MALLEIRDVTRRFGGIVAIDDLPCLDVERDIGKRLHTVGEDLGGAVNAD